LRKRRTVGGIDAREPARAEQLPVAVAELELDPAAQHDVELLLALVEVGPGLVARRQHDRVGAERGDTERRADLAEAGALPEPVDAGDGVAVPGDDLLHGVHWTPFNPRAPA
jgi:hypothetical protein